MFIVTAGGVNSWANWLLILSLIVGLVSTFALVTSGKIKEKEFKRELSDANVDAEKAKALAADANIKTTTLHLKIEEQSRKRVEAELSLRQIELTMLKVSKELASLGVEIESMPKIHMGEIPPENPQKGDLWIDTK